jgi:CheY-like chemotaxis protein
MHPELPMVSVLLVDDRQENLLALEVTLESLGQRLVTATSGAGALLAVAAEQFALILMDIRMPDLDGFATLARLKQAGLNRETPIIFLTAYPEQSLELQSYASGAVDFILKPFDPDTVRYKVGVFVRLRQNAIALERALAALQVARERCPNCGAAVGHGERGS